MSNDDIDSIGTMMLGELRDVHNLEKEMLETKEAVVVQERRFEQEVENLCALDKRKVRLENHFNDLLESVFIEYDRVSQCIAEYMSKLSSLSIGDRVENYFTSRKFCGTKSLEFINCHRALQTKITAINDKSRSDIKGEISFIENGLRLKKIALQEQRNGLLNLSMREETNASASKMLQLEHTHKNLEIETAQLEFYRIGDALEIGLANEAEVDIEVVKMKLSNESEMHCLNSCLTNIILKLNEIADRNITLVTEVQEKVLHNEALADQSILLRRQHQEMFDRLESTISITREAKDAISETESDICLKRRDIFLIQSQTEALKLRAANFIFADSSNLDVLKLDAQANRLKSATEILNRNFKLVNSEVNSFFFFLIRQL